MGSSDAVDVLLVGGGVASVRCARALRREGFDGSVLIVGEETPAPYNRPPLTKEFLREDVGEDLLAAEPSSWYERRGIGLRTDSRVVALDPDARRATLADGSTIGFGRCLLATGAEPIVPPIPGVESGLLVRTLADAHRLRAAVAAAPPTARVVVVGGGLIGVEVASALAERGLRPVLIEQADSLWAGALGERVATWGREQLEGIGVAVRLSSRVTRLEAGSVWIGDERLDVAFAVIGVGVRPRTEIARDADIEVDDGILTDTEHRSSRSAVWAAGDVARVDGLRFEHWHAAREGGERVARSMLGLPQAPHRVPWLFTEVAGINLDVFGSAGDMTEERAIGDRLVARLTGGRLTQLAGIDGAIEPEIARALVESGASASKVAEAFGAG